MGLQQGYPAQVLSYFRLRVQVDVQSVQIGFSVRDKDGLVRAGLSRDDLEVVEDGKAQKVVRWAAAERLPLKFGILVDLSGSQAEFVRAHQHDVETFLDTVLSPGDEAFLVGFRNRLGLLSDYSDRSNSLVRNFELGSKDVNFPLVGPDVRRNGGTAFFDAICRSIREKFIVEAGRRSIAAIRSDGGDNSSGFTSLGAIGTWKP